jgi:branched-chain amino acid transport system permease protein
MLTSTVLEERKSSLVAIPIAIAALAVAPFLVSGSQLVTLITLLEFGTLTLAWTMFSGPTRYVSLATASLFGVGVYTTALLRDSLPLAVLVIIGAALAVALAAAIGVLTLRLRGVYFILFTFGVTALIRSSVQYWEAHVSLTVGRHVTGASNETVYFWMMVIFSATLIAAFVLANSQTGMALIAIGENQDAAEHIGIDVTRVKVLTFAASAVFMGAAGAVMATRFRYVEPAIAFNPLVSFFPVVMAIFGGTSRLWGPLLGTAVLIVLRDILITQYPYWYLLLFGVLLIVVVVWLPGGMTELAIRSYWRIKIEYMKTKFKVTMWWRERQET